MFSSLWPHEMQHTRLPCPSLSPWVYSNSSPWSHWCHPTISSSVVIFSSCLQSFPSLGSTGIQHWCSQRATGDPRTWWWGEEVWRQLRQLTSANAIAHRLKYCDICSASMAAMLAGFFSESSGWDLLQSRSLGTLVPPVAGRGIPCLSAWLLAFSVSQLCKSPDIVKLKWVLFWKARVTSCSPYSFPIQGNSFQLGIPS